jgi:hypothetical protein
MSLPFRHFSTLKAAAQQERLMAASLRLFVLGLIGACLLPSTSSAQGIFGGGHRRFGGRTATPQEIENHLRGYNAGNHKHGGYGYGGGAGYGYAGGYGSGYGGFFFPGYGNTYGLYPYGPGYNYSSPNYAPPPRMIARPIVVLPSNPAPLVESTLPPAAQPPAPFPAPPSVPLVEPQTARP